MKKILVVGSGGREHAIVDALSRSPRVEKIYCAPGNAGIARQAECVAIGAEEIEQLADFAEKNGIDLTVVGPEASLCAGIANEFEKRGLKIFGPTKEAARIESSKEFAKEIMMKKNVPTGTFQTFENFEEALDYVRKGKLPTVIKYDGLAAGKGVVVAQSLEEVEKALRDMLLDENFGSGKVLIEEFLDGPEFSFMCMVNGDKVYPLAMAQDHKRAFEDDKGPNTGGMGAYSPVDFVTEEVEKRAYDEIMKPVAEALAEEGTPFRGLLYGGLILTEDGPKVIEFNARFGDPETEVVLPRLESDLVEMIEAVMEKRDYTAKWSDEGCLGIVVAAEGYPGSYRKGIKLEIPENDDRLTVYHMGTKASEDGVVSAGGRILMAVGRDKDLRKARETALESVEKIAPEGGVFYRKDIGKKSLGKEK